MNTTVKRHLSRTRRRLWEPAKDVFLGGFLAAAGAYEVALGAGPAWLVIVLVVVACALTRALASAPEHRAPERRAHEAGDAQGPPAPRGARLSHAPWPGGRTIQVDVPVHVARLSRQGGRFARNILN